LIEVKGEKASGAQTRYLEAAPLNGDNRNLINVAVQMPEDRREALVGSIPGPRMVRMTSLLVCAFFDIYLRKKPSAF